MSNNQGGNKRSPLVALLVGIVVVILAVISQITGVDLLSFITTPTPSAVVTPTPRVDIRPTVIATGDVDVISLPLGTGAAKDFWEVYFTQPNGSTDESTYIGGIDQALAGAIGEVDSTLDIAAFEWNNQVLTQAVLDAHERGVRVRVAADNEHTVEEFDSTISQLEDAGIPIVYDERSALMHNKFMIMDGTRVWTGSTNYTRNGVFRNNNNMLSLRSRRAVETYQDEFNEMFEDGAFGGRNSVPNDVSFNQDGVIVRIMFSPDDEVVDALTGEIAAAESEIRFMSFSFTLDEIGDALLAAAERGVDIQGIFEVRGSETEFSEMTRLHCAGLDMRQDGNNFTMHHKVFIIDEAAVITGSFNFSQNATRSNDENMVIIYDADLAAQYLAEFERVQNQASTPDDLSCN